MNPHDINPGARLWINTNHTNLPAWAWTDTEVNVDSAPQQDGYALVHTRDGVQRRIHTSHLRTTPTPLGAPRSQTLTGAVHRIKPDAGEELSLLNLLEEA